MHSCSSSYLCGVIHREQSCEMRPIYGAESERSSGRFSARLIMAKPITPQISPAIELEVPIAEAI